MRLSVIRALSSCTRSLPQRDFFGIADVTTKDIAGISSGTKLPQEAVDEKYEPLKTTRNRLEREEVVVDKVFGRLRFDSDNIPKSHGQYERDNEKKLYDTIDIKQRYVPDRVEDDASLLQAKEPPAPKPRRSNPFIALKETTQEVFENVPAELKLSGHTLQETELESNIVEAVTKPIESEQKLVYEPKKDIIPLHELDPLSIDYFDRHMKEVMDDSRFDKKLDEKFEPPAASREKNSVRSMKLADYLKKVRASEIEATAKGLKHRLQREDPLEAKTDVKLDSCGFRVYTNQVTNWKTHNRDEILEMIKKTIVYNNYDILAVNKPYGIASHEETKSREPIDMKSLVEEVAASLRIEKVYLAHRLDKSTTGVLLFATSLERARDLAKQFKSDQIKKTYLCITKGVPDPPHAIVDIPIGEFIVGGKARSCVAPENLPRELQLCQKFREARRAITEYRVISQQKHCALVEVKPRSGVKHQIRVHMSFGLGKPILGDHKYSHLGKVAPQVLPVPLLNALQLRQSKVRTLPVHLHAKSVMIPSAKANGETLFIRAPVPTFFMENLGSLKLLNDEAREIVAKQ